MTMKKIFLILYLSAVCFLSNAQKVDTSLWSATGGAVNAILKDNNTIYIGGAFTKVGPNTGCLVGLNPDNAKIISNKLKINPGLIHVVIPDVNGGLYIGGDFSISTASFIYTDLIRLKPDGSIDTTFKTPTNGSVRALYLRGTKLYVAGKFTTIGSQSRSNIAEIDIIAGAVTIWNPGTNDEVFSLQGKGSKLYVGGAFTILNSQARKRVGCIDLNLGLTTNWQADIPSGNVQSIQLHGANVYLGGSFQTINNTNRFRIAALDSVNGSLLAWDPNANNTINVLYADGQRIYAGGNFSSIGGFGYNRLAAIDTGTGQALPWVPNPDGNVYSIFVEGNTVYAGGSFQNIGGQPRNGGARINANGAVDDWTPGFNNEVRAIYVSAGTVWAGGNFSSANEGIRNRLAAIDLSTGMLTDWNPNASNTVNTLALAGDYVYAGGIFTSIGIHDNSRLAAIHKQSGQPADWKPNPNNTVTTMKVHNNQLFVGGYFTSINGVNRSKLAVYDLETRELTNFNANVHSSSSRYVSAIEIRDSILYLGGYFSNVYGQSRTNLASVNLNTMSLNSWNPAPNSPVRTLHLHNALLYVGGDFTSISGQTRQRIAALELTSGLATAWNPGASNTVYGIQAAGSTVYAVGYFTSIGGQSRSYLAAIDSSGTGLAKPWTCNATAPIYTLWLDAKCSSEQLFVGGDFVSINGVNQKGLAAVSGINQVTITKTTTDVSCNALSDGAIAVSITGGAGPFTYSTDNVNFQPSGTFTGLPAGDYSVYLKDASSCVIESFAKIYEPSAIQLNSSVNPETCEGQQNGSINLAISGGTAPYTYTWTGANGSGSSLTGLAGGDYSVAVKDSRNCSKSESFSIGSTPLPDAAFESSTNEATIILNNQSTGAPESFHWNFGDGSTSSDENPSHTYQAEGTYNVCLKATNSCGVDSICKVISINLAGTASIGNSSRIDMYPNPTENLLHIRLSGTNTSQPIRYSLTDLSGRIVKEVNQSQSHNFTVDLSRVEYGIYFLNLYQGGQTSSFRVIRK